LHVPCFSSETEKFDAVQVLTLGDASWRLVATPGASCNLDHGLVTIDGTMFWISTDSKPVIMSLDLEHERLTSTKPMPVRKGKELLRLVELHGRLGVTAVGRSYVKNTQVLVLQDSIYFLTIICQCRYAW
jgi:F-box interacting protein